jgi:hypothetical protein
MTFNANRGRLFHYGNTAEGQVNMEDMPSRPLSDMMPHMTTKPRSQLDKFKQAARELETDDDEARFDERVRKLVKHKPVEKPE